MTSKNSLNAFKEKPKKRKTIHGFSNVVILPLDEKTQLTKIIKEVVYEILDKYKSFQELQNYNSYYIRVPVQILPGENIQKACNVWIKPHFSEIKTPFVLPRKGGDFICQNNHLLIKVECVNSATKSYRSGEWDVDGYMLLILADSEKRNNRCKR